MIIIRDLKELGEKRLVATIGFFDGVHLGHRFLIEEMRQVARKRELPSAVITFSEHPRTILQKSYQPQLLNSFGEKLEHLATTGVDYCIVLNFTVELSRLTAQEFITTILYQQLHVQTLVVGYDHRFGHDRKDGFEQYQLYGKACGMEILQATAYNSREIKVSSSEIRKQLAACQVETAAQLLTYPYQLKGHVVKGYKIGRKLGYPTANIQIDESYKMIPGIGVYAVWVKLEDKSYKGMLYIGNRPTLENGEHITLEVNMLDFEGDIYNKELIVSFIYHIRKDQKFNSLEDLKKQLEADRQTVIKLLSDKE